MARANGGERSADSSGGIHVARRAPPSAEQLQEPGSATDEAAFSPSDVLAKARENRFVVQDFRPLRDSVEWRLGQHYYQERGSKGFIADAAPIPFLINNDGSLSARAAELLYQSLAESERERTLEDTVLVLELGIGVGLFARFFLDRLRDLCSRSGKDYYDRVCYVAADRSEKMLLDACRHGIFSDHPGKYVLRVADAGGPLDCLVEDLAFHECAPARIRAVFLNYVLDCLPAAVLQVDDNDVRELCIKT
jgi:hypothetical protein